jgi:hypothetical protein
MQVIEAKCRVNPVRSGQHPPLYDQIQLVTYLFMLGLTSGDLVEYHTVTTKSRPAVTTKSRPAVTTKSRPAVTTSDTATGNVDTNVDADAIILSQLSQAPPLSLSRLLPPLVSAPLSSVLNITRVSLADTHPYHHGANWHQVIYPRIEQFVAAVKTLRVDDNIRYQWLTASDEEKTSIARKLCPHY